jgi:hypothetical protein
MIQSSLTPVVLVLHIVRRRWQRLVSLLGAACSDGT